MWEYLYVCPYVWGRKGTLRFDSDFEDTKNQPWKQKNVITAHAIDYRSSNGENGVRHLRNVFTLH